LSRLALGPTMGWSHGSKVTGVGGAGGGEAGRLLPSGSICLDSEYRDNFTFCYHLW